MAQRPTVTQMSRKFESHAFTIRIQIPMILKKIDTPENVIQQPQ